MKPVLFIDFDGTICTDRFWKSLTPELNARIQNDFFKGDLPRVQRWMRGGYTSEEITTHLVQIFDCDYDELGHTFVSDCKSFALETEVFEAIGEASESYTTVLMTDNMDCFDRWIVSTLALNTIFDLVWNSYNQGVLKNDDNGEAYMNVCEELGTTTTDCILVDDREQSISTFTKLGGHGYLTSGPKVTREYLKELSNAPKAL